MQDDTQDTGVQAVPADEAQSQADTAPNQENLADVQVTNETPEASQDKQGETQSLETNAEDTAPEERLYAGKYKTVEDMERAYSELNSKATRDAQEKAELARILNESFSTPEQPVQQAQADEYDDYQQPDPVAQRITALENNLIVSNFVLNHPDAVGMADTLNEVLNSDPVVNAISDPNARLEHAYLKSKSLAEGKTIEQAKKEAANQTTQTLAAKQAAQVEAVRKQSAPVNDNEGLSPSEIRAAARDDKAFDDLIQKRFPGISKMRSQT